MEKTKVIDKNLYTFLGLEKSLMHAARSLEKKPKIQRQARKITLAQADSHLW